MWLGVSFWWWKVSRTCQGEIPSSTYFPIHIINSDHSARSSHPDHSWLPCRSLYHLQTAKQLMWETVLYHWCSVGKDGPSTEPCGTPDVTSSSADDVPSTTTLCFRSAKKLVGGTRSHELSLPGTFTPWNFRSLELLFPGTFAPKQELLLFTWLANGISS